MFTSESSFKFEHLIAKVIKLLSRSNHTSSRLHKAEEHFVNSCKYNFENVIQ